MVFEQLSHVGYWFDRTDVRVRCRRVARRLGKMALLNLVQTRVNLFTRGERERDSLVYEEKINRLTSFFAKLVRFIEERKIEIEDISRIPWNPIPREEYIRRVEKYRKASFPSRRKRKLPILASISFD